MNTETGRRTVYEAAGGEPAFFTLVERFYEGVATDPVIRPMYPEDLTDSIRHLALFFVQYFGGPTTYSEERGHPRLRMRHNPFPIDQAARDAWMSHMRAAVDSMPWSDTVRKLVLEYFEGAATFLVNRQTLQIG